MAESKPHVLERIVRKLVKKHALLFSWRTVTQEDRHNENNRTSYVMVCLSSAAYYRDVDRWSLPSHIDV